MCCTILIVILNICITFKGQLKSYILTRQIGSATNYMKLENISELKVPIVDYDMQEKL